MIISWLELVLMVFPLLFILHKDSRPLPCLNNTRFFTAMAVPMGILASIEVLMTKKFTLNLASLASRSIGQRQKRCSMRSYFIRTLIISSLNLKMFSKNMPRIANQKMVFLLQPLNKSRKNSLIFPALSQLIKL